MQSHDKVLNFGAVVIVSDKDIEQSQIFFCKSFSLIAAQLKYFTQIIPDFSVIGNYNFQVFRKLTYCYLAFLNLKETPKRFLQK